MIKIVMGYNGGGKSTLVEDFVKQGFARLNRDTEGGTIDAMALKADGLVAAGKKDIVLDNTYPTVASRASIIAAAKRNKLEIECVWLKTTIEDTQVNVATRMMQKKGRLLMPDEFKGDPGFFPPAVIFKYKKDFEKPTTKEGFSKITEVPFIRKPSGYKGKAILLDYDGTLRTTKSGAKYPSDPKDVEILPNRKQILNDWIKKGYRLLGVSNQGDVGRGKVTLQQVVDCFERTNELLGINVEYSFCPHHVPPISCWCRKPMPGLPIQFVEKYKLDKAQCVLVGDMTSDETCAERAGIKFVHADEFFK